MMIERESWPYCFALSDDFQKTERRGCISGRLLVRDRYLDDADLYATAAYVGLALPGDAGSWQRDCKGYKFWCREEDDARFCIRNIVTGDYNLYAWVPGFIGDYKLDATLTISSGDDIYLGNLVCEPPREGPTMWEIGIPDRSASEFYVPDPNPNYGNRLYINHPDRQYGLWERYAELYLDSDLGWSVLKRHIKGKQNQGLKRGFLGDLRNTGGNKTRFEVSGFLDGLRNTEISCLQMLMSSHDALYRC